MKRLVILTGAGISAESGLKTFRDMGGLWENHKIEDVATPEAWRKNPALVLQFYNERRLQAFNAEPNAAHYALAELEKHFEVNIITQNVDNLHEKAGSNNVMHLHGELSKVRSEKDEYLISDIGGGSIKVGDLAKDGQQLRPHIVWFGENVPLITTAADICSKADVFVVIGTSLAVYPAADLIYEIPSGTPIYCIDPNIEDNSIKTAGVIFYKEPASTGVTKLIDALLFFS